MESRYTGIGDETDTVLARAAQDKSLGGAHSKGGAVENGAGADDANSQNSAGYGQNSTNQVINGFGREQSSAAAVNAANGSSSRGRTSYPRDPTARKKRLRANESLPRRFSAADAEHSYIHRQDAKKARYSVSALTSDRSRPIPIRRSDIVANTPSLSHQSLSLSATPQNESDEMYRARENLLQSLRKSKTRQGNQEGSPGGTSDGENILGDEYYDRLPQFSQNEIKHSPEDVVEGHKSPQHPQSIFSEEPGDSNASHPPQRKQSNARESMDSRRRSVVRFTENFELSPEPIITGSGAALNGNVEEQNLPSADVASSNLREENRELRRLLWDREHQIQELTEALLRERQASDSRLSLMSEHLREKYSAKAQAKLSELVEATLAEERIQNERRREELEALVAQERWEKSELVKACDTYFGMTGY